MKHIQITLALVTLLMSLASCGGGVTQNPNTVTPPVNTSDTSPTPSEATVPSEALAAIKTYETRYATALQGGDASQLSPEDSAYIASVRESGKSITGLTIKDVSVVVLGRMNFEGDKGEADILSTVTFNDDEGSVTDRQVHVTLVKEGGAWKVTTTTAIEKQAMAEPSPLSSQALSTSPAVILARATAWVNAKVPYNQGAWRYVDGISYRQDCSGFVSMAWGLSSSPDTTNTWRYANEVSLDQLQAGDAVNNQRPGNGGHIVLFVSWINKAAGTFRAMEENGGYGRAVSTNLTLVRYGNGWTIKEYNNVARGPYVFQRSKAIGSAPSTPTRPDYTIGAKLYAKGIQSSGTIIFSLNFSKTDYVAPRHGNCCAACQSCAFAKYLHTYSSVTLNESDLLRPP